MSIDLAYKPIRDYGLIGNCRSAALVGTSGSIDWCCFPRFDSPSIFAAVLDRKTGGRFSLSPSNPHSSVQRYAGETNVLETVFTSEGGSSLLSDAMPLYDVGDAGVAELYQIIRHVRCVEGTVDFEVYCEPRPDYGRTRVSPQARGSSVVWTDGSAELSLDTPAPLQIRGGAAHGSFRLRAGEELAFTFSYRDPTTREHLDGLSPTQRVEATKAFWRQRAAELDYEGPWRDAVLRSYLVLHLLSYAPTGGIVAAPTTSLPEEMGGARNWDYRYTWLRDAAFTIEALMALGHRDDALAFFQWLARICDRVCADPEGDFQILYRVDGDSHLGEEELAHLEGHKGSRPVRIGNGAYDQVQLDIYGELLASAYLMASGKTAFGDKEWGVMRTLANLAAKRWKLSGQGMWEIRGGPYHFVYPKVMCWSALTTAAALAEQSGRSGLESDEWRRTAESIKADVLDRGWSARKGAFKQHYGSEAMDAANLLIPLTGFLSFDDPRVVSTVSRIRQELGYGPFLHRYRTEETDDGVAGSEGAFILCSFWLVRVLARMGQQREARDLFEQLLACSNHLGLYSEMVDPSTGEFLGNFPQAFTHIGLILAAKECGRPQSAQGLTG